MPTAPHNHQPDPQPPTSPPPPSGPATPSPGALALVGVVVLALLFTGFLVAQYPGLNEPVLAAVGVGSLLVTSLVLVLRR